jgi:dTDP-4-amino-4,6-dideoxygalactose transaminase
MASRDVDGRTPSAGASSRVAHSHTHATTATRVPFLDLKRVNARLRASMDAAIRETIDSGRYLNGNQVASFEREFALWNGVPHCVSVANGLDALRLCMLAWISLGRLKKGDEVVVPANTFIATALAATDAGLTLRFADVDAATYNATRETIEAALTPATRVVIAVHLYGQLADAHGIAALCMERNLLLLEDAAQAHGAHSGGRRAGSFGHAGAFSFYPSKNLGALGDGGALITRDAALAERVRTLANYGAARRYEHEFLGTNSRLDEVQAAVLRCKLETLDDDNARRRANAQRYLGGIRNAAIGLPRAGEPPEAHVWHIFAVTVRNRGSFVDYLSARGVETLIHYPHAVHLQPAYRALGQRANAPQAERLQDVVVSLPMSPVLDEEQIEYTIGCANEWSN